MSPGDRVLYLENNPINLSSDLGKVLEVGADGIRVLFDDGLDVYCNHDQLKKVVGLDIRSLKSDGSYDAKGHSNRYP